MNRGFAIFKRMQRLQRGSDYVPTPVTPTRDYPFTTDEEFIRGRYPHETQDQDLAHLTPEEQAQEQIDWEKNIKEILTMTPDLTPEERRQVTELNPKDWDDSTREKVGVASEKAGTDMQLARGTVNVMKTPQVKATNPGLQLYKDMIQSRGTYRPRRELPQQFPQFAKGSSGIHINPANKGKFTATQKATGKSVAELKNSPNPLTRKRANFAMMAKRHFKPL